MEVGGTEEEGLRSMKARWGARGGFFKRTSRKLSWGGACEVV